MALVYSITEPGEQRVASAHLSQERALGAAPGFPTQLTSANEQIA